MADATYTPKVYRKQGGEAFIVASGGEVEVESGGQIQMLTGAKMVPNSGTQASHIANITTTGTFSTGICAKIQSIIAAVRGVGILATS